MIKTTLTNTPARTHSRFLINSRCAGVAGNEVYKKKNPTAQKFIKVEFVCFYKH